MDLDDEPEADPRGGERDAEVKVAGGFGHAVRMVLSRHVGSPTDTVVLLNVLKFCDGKEIRAALSREGATTVWTRNRVSARGQVGQLMGYDKAWLATATGLGVYAVKDAMERLRNAGLLTTRLLQAGGRNALGVDLAVLQGLPETPVVGAALDAAKEVRRKERRAARARKPSSETGADAPAPEGGAAKPTHGGPQDPPSGGPGTHPGGGLHAPGAGGHATHPPGGRWTPPNVDGHDAVPDHGDQDQRQCVKTVSGDSPERVTRPDVDGGSAGEGVGCLDGGYFALDEAGVRDLWRWSRWRSRPRGAPDSTEGDHRLVVATRHRLASAQLYDEHAARITGRVAYYLHAALPHEVAEGIIVTARAACDIKSPPAYFERVLIALLRGDEEQRRLGFSHRPADYPDGLNDARDLGEEAAAVNVAVICSAIQAWRRSLFPKVYDLVEAAARDPAVEDLRVEQCARTVVEAENAGHPAAPDLYRAIHTTLANAKRR